MLIPILFEDASGSVGSHRLIIMIVITAIRVEACVKTAGGNILGAVALCDYSQRKARR